MTICPRCGRGEKKMTEQNPFCLEDKREKMYEVWAYTETDIKQAIRLLRGDFKDGVSYSKADINKKIKDNFGKGLCNEEKRK